MLKKITFKRINQRNDYREVVMIIGIEGVVCAGKTTIAIRLEKKGFIPISEYGVYTNGHGSFPPFPRSLADAKFATDFFMKVEAKRHNSLISKLKQVGARSNYVVDRTYHSCLSFDFALSQYMHFDAFSPSIKNWMNSPKIEPFMVFILDIDFSTLMNRNQKRCIRMLPHFLNREFIEAQRYYYQKLAHSQPNLYILVDGKLPKEEIERIILNHLNIDS